MDTRHATEVVDQPLVEQLISAFVAAHVITVNTLHARGVVDKRHLAHAFARACDVLPEGELVKSILQTITKYHMQVTPGTQPDVREWVASVAVKNLEIED